MGIKIGIDPDLEKNGYCLLIDGEIKELAILDFFDLLERIYCRCHNVPGALVVIEAGWLKKKSNWHGGKNTFIRERIAKNVGENHACGKLIAAYCERKGIAFKLRGPIGKVDAERFNKLTGWAKRTNQEVRDACLMVWA